MLKHKVLIILAGLVIALLGIGGTTHAAVPVDCPDGFVKNITNPTPESVAAACAGHETGGQQDDFTESKRIATDCEVEDKDGGVNAGNCKIIYYVVTFIRILSALVGIVVVTMITLGGIQYSAAKDSPQAVAAARGRITNAIIALIAYILMFSVLQYLVPGGVL